MKFTREDYNERIIDKAGKIPGDEPVFLLRAQDVYAPSTLRYYARLLEEAGNLEMAEELRWSCPPDGGVAEIGAGAFAG